MMLNSIAAWALFALMLVAVIPLAACLAAPAPSPRGRAALNWAGLLALTPALYAGIVSLLMLALGLVRVPFHPLLVIALYAGTALAGWLAARRARLTGWRLGLPQGGLARVALAICIVVVVSALFNGVYLPFYRDDALGIYAPQARALFATGALIPLPGEAALYRAYPMLVQFNYAFAYSLSDWENEYLAKGVGTLLGLAALPACWMLAREIGGRTAGWLAVLLLALAPTVGKWASAGYVDLPMATYYTLCAGYALRWMRTLAVRDAALAGVMLGLAAWTKNAALLGVPVLGAWLLAGLFMHRARSAEALRGLGAAALACALVAGPWYARNLLDAGLIVPATAWTDQAEPTPNNLLVLVRDVPNYALSGVVVMASVAAAALALLSSGSPARPPLPREGIAVCLVFGLPFFAAWWLFVSYDPRFLLLPFPILCALGGVVGARVYAAFSVRLLRLAGAAVALLLAGYIAYNNVDYKDDILRQPFMSHETKRAMVGRSSDEASRPLSP